MAYPNNETHQPDPDTCIAGCVAENNSKYLSAAARLVRSIRWFGGRMYTPAVSRADFILGI